MTALQSFVALIGRICFSLIFIIAGADKIMNFNETLQKMTDANIHFADEFGKVILIIAIIFELGGGLLVFIGWFTRFGAFLLFIFILGVSYYFHDFWTMLGADKINQMQHALKNLSMIGATLYIMAYGAGCCSFDRLRCKGKSSCKSSNDV